MALRQLPLVMGVVNVTPDSFSDGGRYLDPSAAIEHGLALAADGADLLDVGGEATNPRAAPIDAREELRRVLPVIEALVAAGATVSIDTTKAEVARAAVAAGATIVNDVSGGLFDPAMAEALADLDATTSPATCAARRSPRCSRRSRPARRRAGPRSRSSSGQRLAALPPAVRARAWVDPGVGFGKGRIRRPTWACRRAGELRLAVRRPVVVGLSRKRFLRRLDGERRRGGGDGGGRGSGDGGGGGSSGGRGSIGPDSAGAAVSGDGAGRGDAGRYGAGRTASGGQRRA